MPRNERSNSVWYLQASEKEHDPSNLPAGLVVNHGSAVAIRLQKKDGYSARTYLLTCAHVLLRTIDDRKKMGDKFLPVIWAWPPECGLTRKMAHLLKVFYAPIGEDWEIDSLKPIHDWVVLEFIPPDAAEGASHVCTWANTDSERAYEVYGYKGGEFPRDIVSSNKCEDSFTLQQEIDSIIHLEGDATRAGVSGGGVFCGDRICGELAGIHRSRNDKKRNVCAISAKYIQERLKERHYLVVDCECENTEPELKKIDFDVWQSYITFLKAALKGGRFAEAEEYKSQFCAWFIVVENSVEELLNAANSRCVSFDDETCEEIKRCKVNLSGRLPLSDVTNLIKEWQTIGPRHESRLLKLTQLNDCLDDLIEAVKSGRKLLPKGRMNEKAMSSLNKAMRTRLNGLQFATSYILAFQNQKLVNLDDVLVAITIGVDVFVEPFRDSQEQSE